MSVITKSRPIPKQIITCQHVSENNKMLKSNGDQCDKKTSKTIYNVPVVNYTDDIYNLESHPVITVEG